MSLDANFNEFLSENDTSEHSEPIDFDKDRIVVFSSSSEGLKEYCIALNRSGAKIAQTSKISEAKNLLKSNDYSALMVDVTVADRNGMDLMKWSKRELPPTIKIFGFVRTYFPDILITELVLGANGMFLMEGKQFIPLARVLHLTLINNPHLGWTRDIATKQGEVSKKVAASGNPATPMLLLGSEGVGKIALAVVAHSMSSRYEYPFILADSTPKYQFHTIKRSEVDNRTNRKLIRESLQDILGMAYNGTIYFRSIHHLPLMSQEVLYEVLKVGKCRVPGDDSLKTFKGRVIFSTNTDIESLIDEGKFSSNLYQLISHNVMRVPSLNEFKSEIPILARSIIRDTCIRLNAKTLKLSAKAEKALLEHTWRGNLNELYMVLQEAMQTTTGPFISAEDLKLAKSYSTHTKDNSDKVEEENIRDALIRADGNKRQAARSLKMSPGKLYARMKKYGIPMDFK